VASARKRKDQSRTEGELPSLADLFQAAGVSSVSSATSEEQGRTGSQETHGRIERAVLRKSRKGRGGHTVTLVEVTGLKERELADLARRMGRDLGCGARVEEGHAVLQGDQVERAELWLRKEGVCRLSRGG
jgi:translation initiation factor 1 (eIF-1/SUI1)